MRFKSLISKLFNLTLIGNLPINSGIKPHFSKVLVFKQLSFGLTGLIVFTPVVKPITPFSFFSVIVILSKAPPQINKIFDVSIVTTFLYIAVFPTVISTLLPSISFKSACCTPSPDTSLELPAASCLAILSISSMYTIPCSALSTSISQDCSNLKSILSTSSPT